MNLVIVGGGAAGWLTALTAKQNFPESNVSLIESKEIGILGAGEGTTPNLIAFLDYLNIPFSALVKNANATYKTGVKFTNWKNDNSYYYHNFGANVYPTSEFTNNWGQFDLTSFLNVYCSTPVSDHTLDGILNDEYKIHYRVSKSQEVVSDPIFSFEKIGLGWFAFNFDASKLAETLKEIGIQRGINLIEGKVVTITDNSDGDITSLTLESGQKINLDFVFDCSGFFRLIIGKHYKSEWKSYKEKLPVDAAIPFFLNIDSVDVNKIPPYSEAIAMKYGWMWKIPLQNRFGCGYVYDSSLITDKEAIKEIEDYLGFEPFYPRKDKGGFAFNAGHYTRSWINNCVAIGLSSGFIEPLEATSLMTAVESLKIIFSTKQNLISKNSYTTHFYNDFITQYNAEIFDFIYFHYMSGRTDTDFWKKFTYENASKKLQNKIDVYFKSVPFIMNTDLNHVFFYNNWFDVAVGIGMVDTNLIKEYIELNNLTPLINKHENLIHRYKDLANECVSHITFLRTLGAKI